MTVITFVLTTLALALCAYIIIVQALRLAAQTRYAGLLEQRIAKADAALTQQRKLATSQALTIRDQMDVIEEQQERICYYDRVEKRAVRRLINASPVLTIDDPLKYTTEAYMN